MTQLVTLVEITATEKCLYLVLFYMKYCILHTYPGQVYQIVMPDGIMMNSIICLKQYNSYIENNTPAKIYRLVLLICVYYLSLIILGLWIVLDTDDLAIDVEGGLLQVRQEP